MKNLHNFKSLPGLWAGILILGFCLSLNAQTATLEYPAAEADMKTAKATVKAYEQQDWEQLRTYLSETATIFGLASFDSLNVDQTISYWTKGTETAIPNLTDETWLGIAIPSGPKEGNWVYHWGTNTLKYPSGETISFPYHLALKIQDNKIEEAHFYYDNMKIIRGMGYAISPPLESEDLESLEGMNLEMPNKE